MSIQNIMWTTLPNGFTPAGDKLKLSVLVSPRLITNGPAGTLAEFPDFLDWPTVVSHLTFRVEFQGGPIFPANPVVEPGFPALEAWLAECERSSDARAAVDASIDRDPQILGTSDELVGKNGHLSWNQGKSGSPEREIRVPPRCRGAGAAESSLHGSVLAAPPPRTATGREPARRRR